MDECGGNSNSNGCVDSSKGGSCLNSPGSYSCICKDGFCGDGKVNGIGCSGTQTEIIKFVQI